ncbi:NXPE family member 3-like [Branchiostoma floridae x Branchiostoma belcheri]
MTIRRITAVFGTLSLGVLLSLCYYQTNLENGKLYSTNLQKNDELESRYQSKVRTLSRNQPSEEVKLSLEKFARPNNAIYDQGIPTEDATHSKTHIQDDLYNRVTYPDNTKFVVLNSDRVYRKGDVLTAVIVARDVRGRPKTYGGDFFRAKLVSIRPGEASCAGHVTDHGNGTYTVQFPLYWAGGVRVSIQLVHPSEAVEVLQRVRDVPGKRAFSCLFIDANQMENREKRQCSTTRPPDMPLNQLCDFSRREANGSWFCERPESLSCDAIVACRRDITQKGNETTILVSEDELNLFLRPYIEVELEQDNPTLTPIRVKESSLLLFNRRPECPGSTPGALTQGFWFYDSWKSSVCRVRNFTRTSMRRCLANKRVYLQGDSTVRQWFLWLAEGHSKGSLKPGPATVFDKHKNIFVQYRFHGLPVLGSHWMNFSKIRYVVDELDSMTGGPNTVIVLGLWAHFTTESLEMFRARLHAIQNAIHRLLQRSPGTRVFVRTGTTREHKGYTFYLRGSDWLAYQITEEIRQIFRTDRDVVVLDTWDMSVCQWEPDNIHPGPALIDSQINMLLSHICPK